MKIITVKLFTILISFLVCFLLIEASLQIAAKFVYDENNIYVSTANTRPIYILAIGESTTLLGGESSYPSILQDLLDNTFGSNKFKVINAGIAGTNTTRILANLPANLKKYNPQIVLSMIGINDRWGLPMEKYPILTWAENRFRVVRLLKYAYLNLFYSNNVKAEGIEAAKYPRDLQHRLILFDKDEKEISFLVNDSHQKKEIICDRNEFSENLSGLLPYAPTNYSKKKSISTKEHVIHIIDYLLATKGSASSAQIITNIIPDLRHRSCFLINYHMVYENETSRDKIDFERMVAENIIAQEKSVPDAVADIVVQTSDSSQEWIDWAFQNKTRSALIMYEQAERLLQKSPEQCEHFLRNRLIYAYAQDFSPSFVVYLKALLKLGKKKIVKRNLSRLKEIAMLAEGWGIFARLRIDGNSIVERSAADKLFSLQKTIKNYRELRSLVVKQNRLLLPMQYPLQDIDSLRDVLPDHKRKYFIENKSNFERKLKRIQYEVLFTDRFAGSFGHTTKSGATLIAENILDKIIQLQREGIITLSSK